ncbi:hypothetical protein [Ruminococcus sp.]|uniref:hypothetical protein n=1 Tax=Ruminococcus sp. TaxID=41978 RepID=UPI0025E7D40E|nr:hypothetical protein [Ruminococcus sp.]
MGKYRYICFGDEVSGEIEREYNRLCRQEQYQEEKDASHGVVRLDYDSLLQGVADRTSYPEYQEKLKAEQLMRERLDMLPIALEWLKEKYPNDYDLINAYYFSERKINMVYLAEKYGLTHQALSKKMSKARQRLKEFITLYEKQ